MVNDPLSFSSEMTAEKPRSFISTQMNNFLTHNTRTITLTLVRILDQTNTTTRMNGKIAPSCTTPLEYWMRSSRTPLRPSVRLDRISISRLPSIARALPLNSPNWAVHMSLHIIHLRPATACYSTICHSFPAVPGTCTVPVKCLLSGEKRQGTLCHSQVASIFNLPRPCMRLHGAELQVQWGYALVRLIILCRSPTRTKNSILLLCFYRAFDVQ